VSERQKSIGHWDNSDFPGIKESWSQVNNPPPLYLGVSLEGIRQIVREEIDAHDQRGLDRLMADIHRTEPLPEQEEIAALLVTLSEEEWNALVAKVNERRSM
jgi:hypothetical protein